MNFRFEDKLKLNNKKIYEFNEWLLKNNVVQAYPPREIYSIYFDNDNLQTYHDSNEGIVPRLKIRFRTYNYDSINSNNFFMEIKKTLYFGRLKSSVKILNFKKYLKLGIFIRGYGICYPKLIVKYDRSYFRMNKIRITLDQNIRFKKYENLMNNSFFENFKDLVIPEIKYSSKNHLGKFENNLPFEKTRFSKYCIGAEKLNLI
tara:strand:+ start:2017 stop:2625 length:609 start_codon:yes stop_codon:yes gene_type:complete